MRVKQPNGGVSRQEQGSTEIECGTRHLPQTQSLYKVFYFNQPNEVRHVRFRPTLHSFKQHGRNWWIFREETIFSPTKVGDILSCKVCRFTLW